MGLLDDITTGLVPQTIGIEEFAESTEYCNQALFPRQAVLLKLMFLEEMTGKEEDILSEWIESSEHGGEVLISPDIRERRDYLRSRGYKHFREIQLVGGRRSSKGFITGIAMAKVMWDTLQLGDPHEHYGISKTREIYFSCVAASESQAKEFQYGDFVGTVENCKAFQPYLQKSLETEFRVATPADLRRISAAKARSGKIERDTSKLRGKALAANAGTLRGSATMVVTMDEMAHMTVGESKASAKEVYGAAIPSLSQFGIDGMIFCNPPEAPMWMSDLSFKPIGDVKIGDRVMGWDRRDDKIHRDLCGAEVTNIMRRQSPIVKVTTESGRTFRCTPDHRWLTTSYGGKKGYHEQGQEWFCKPEEGREIIHVVDPTPGLRGDQMRDALWLGGMFDGEGHAGRRRQLTICQSRSANPAVCDRIEQALDNLGFEWVYHKTKNAGAYHVLAPTKQTVVDFANWTGPTRVHQLQDKVMTGRWRHKDRIVSVEPDGYGEVVALTTSTGNYICNGFASKNCNSSPYTKVGKFYEIFEVAMRRFDPNRAIALSSANTTGVSENGEVDMSVNGDPRLFSFEYPSWALFEGYMKHKSRWKQRTRGRELGKMPTASPDWDPDSFDADGDPLYSEQDKEFIVSQRNTENADPEVFKVEQRGRFAEVVDSFLIPGMVDRMYQGVPQGMEYDAEGKQQMIYTPIHTNFGTGAMNTYRYKFHLDPSSTTAGFGFAIAHIEHFVNPISGDEEEHCVFDMIKRWDPKSFPGKVIRWKPILDEVAMYADIFRPYEITFDQHQSAEPIQTLHEKLAARNIVCSVYEKVAPQPLDAKVLTPHGWLTMGEIVEGMSVIGSDGLPHEVSGVFPKGEREVYRVTFSDGSSTECTEDHIWRVTSHGERGVEQTLTLREIMGRGLDYGNGVQKWKIKHVDPVQYEQRDDWDPLPVDPYLLGSLLGDGCFHKSVWLAADQRDADEQERLLTPLLPQGMSVTRRDRDYGRGTWSTLYFKRPEGQLLNPLSEKIRELGLWYVAGKDKFIPERYLRASVDDRVALLQGLIDTDGHVGADSYHLSFTTASPSLAYGVADLVGSLGGSATIKKNKGRSTMIVRIKRLPADIVPCRLERKRDRYQPEQRSGRYRHIKSIELVGVKETQCIRVDCDDHLYVTDDYILTHNTNESNWKGWQVLKTAIYQGLVHAPFDESNWNDPTSQNELKFLQEMPTGGKFPKVEKQDIGPVRTKDQADCVRECVHGLIGNIMSTRARERLSNPSVFGGQGGYGIGQSPSPMYQPGGTPVGISDYYASRPDRASMKGGRGAMDFDRASLTRSAMGGRGNYRGGRSRGRGY